MRHTTRQVIRCIRSCGFLALAGLASCASLPIEGLPTPPSAPEAGGGPAFVPATAFGAEDFLLSDYGSDDVAYRTLYVAKMSSPVAQSSGEAEFQRYKDLSKQWTKRFWKVRPGTPADIAADRKVVFFYGNYQEGVSYLPKTQKDAHEEMWHAGTITDLSLLPARGIFIVKDGEGEDFKVQKDNVFVIVPR